MCGTDDRPRHTFICWNYTTNAAPLASFFSHFLPSFFSALRPSSAGPIRPAVPPGPPPSGPAAAPGPGASAKPIPPPDGAADRPPSPRQRLPRPYTSAGCPRWTTPPRSSAKKSSSTPTARKSGRKAALPRPGPKLRAAPVSAPSPRQARNACPACQGETRGAISGPGGAKGRPACGARCTPARRSGRTAAPPPGQGPAP